jgi:hypothetical protein
VIVLIVDENSVFAFESESQPPIGIDLDRPMSPQIALQGMKISARNIHPL